MMGEITVSVLAGMMSLWTGITLSRGSFLHIILTYRMLILGVLIVWFASKAFFVWIGLFWFPSAFAANANSHLVTTGITIVEVIGVPLVLIVSSILHGRNNRPVDPLGRMKKIQEDKRRWMEANGE
jgi:hypothetical protein